MIPTIKTPRTLAAATGLAERFATLEGEIGLVEAGRNEAIARANADADSAIAPMLAERDALRDKLCVWWGKAGPELTDGKRKSITLGGCTIGSRSGRATLSLSVSDDDAIAALLALRGGKGFVRTKVSIDRTAVLKGLDGSFGASLGKIGFSRQPGEESFVLERAEQAGTVADAVKA